MQESISVEEELKNDINLAEAPCKNLIQQSDENGNQTLISKQRGWVSSFCECIKITNLKFFRRTSQPLLPPQHPRFLGKNTLVLDLDETLVHSSFTSTPCDITLTLLIDSNKYHIYVLKRPGLDKFLRICADLYEVVIFTASLEEYASPLLDLLDRDKKIPYRLYRDSCTPLGGSYVKDLSRLGRDLNNVIIVDNSPNSYSLHTMNAVPVKTWIDDPYDQELNLLLKVLEKLSIVNNLPKVLGEIKKRNWTLSAGSVHKLIESEFIPINRGYFNSPIHIHGDKKFNFEDI